MASTTMTAKSAGNELIPRSAQPDSELQAIQREITTVGVLTIVIGLVAVMVPHLFTFAIELFLGAIFIVGGIGEVVRAIRHRKRKGWGWSLAMGALYAVAGAMFLFNPVAGVLALTTVVGAMLFIKGVSAVAYALNLRSESNWGWIALSGVGSILVATLIWAGFPTSALWAVGLLVGIELVFYGGSLIMLGRAVAP